MQKKLLFQVKINIFIVGDGVSYVPLIYFFYIPEIGEGNSYFYYIYIIYIIIVVAVVVGGVENVKKSNFLYKNNR